MSAGRMGLLVVVAASLAGCSDTGVAPQSPRCAAPFDPGFCDAVVPVFAFVDGRCVARVYGGCDGNDNRFDALEECLAVCEGRPANGSCPPGRTPRQIGVACGAGGGTMMLEVCALPCDGDGDCAADGPLTACVDGVCQAGAIDGGICI